MATNWQMVGELKQVKWWANEDKKTGELKYGRMKDSCYRLEFCHKQAPKEVWKITKTKAGFNIHCPERMIPATDNPCDKTMKPAPGRAFNGRATSGTMNLARFMVEMVDQCGQEFAERIVREFLTVLA